VLTFATEASAAQLLLSRALSGGQFQYVVSEGDSFASINSRYGTPGEIVYEPMMLARMSGGRIFVEANPDVYKLEADPLADLGVLADSGNLGNMIDWRQAREAAETSDGLAREVTVGGKTGGTLCPGSCGGAAIR
jgi:hypothetical protein